MSGEKLDNEAKYPRVTIAGVGVSAVGMENALEAISEWVRGNRKEFICLANVFGIVESRHNSELKAAYANAGISTADGVPLVWASHLLGEKRTARVYGPDLMLAACQRSLMTRWSHYFYGGAPGIAERMAKRLSSEFPGLRIAGCKSPPFRKMREEEIQADIESINLSQADILWIGLGAPRQEIWMDQHRKRLTPAVLVAVGAAFDFFSGNKPTPPQWMQNSGLGWLFRLMTEPRRLWKRYLINNPIFIGMFLCQYINFLWRRVRGGDEVNP
jgi:N-acetylglucosaminyldiphosphoundecaprenol N-acetyl-beta-D-mannosaminyltransferase